MNERRELVLVSEAAERLGITPSAIHWHIKHNDVYVEPHGKAAGRKAWFYMVDLADLRRHVGEPESKGGDG